MVYVILAFATSFAGCALLLARVPAVRGTRWTYPVWAVLAVSSVICVASRGAPTGHSGLDAVARLLAAVTIGGGLAMGSGWVALAAAIPVAVAASGGAPGWAAMAAGLAVGTHVAELSGGHRSRLLRVIATSATALAALHLQWPDTTGATALVAAVPLLLGLATAMLRLPGRARTAARLTLGLAVLTAAGCSLSASLEALSMRSTAQRAVDEVDAGMEAARNGDRDGALAHLDVADAAFTTIDHAVHSPRVGVVGWLPILAQHLSVAKEVVTTGRDLTTTARTALTAADPQRLRFSGSIDVEAVRALQGPFEALAGSVDRSIDDLGRKRSPWIASRLGSKIDDLRARLVDVQDEVHRSVDVIDIAPGLLGGDGSRRYFLAVLTPSELRGTIGLLGNYAEITATDGRLQLTNAGRNADLNEAGGPDRHLIAPEEYTRRYGRLNPGQQWEEITASPDFPTVAEVIRAQYPQSGGRPVDGVIAVDPEALAGLLKVTGPITVSGWPEPITADNAARIFLLDQYVAYDDPSDPAVVARSQFLVEATAQIWARLQESALEPRQLADVVAPLVSAKHLMITSFGPGEAAVLHELDADGAVPPVQDDFVGVVTHNRAANKIDSFLQRQIDYHVTVSDAGDLTGEIHVRLHNSAPAKGLPDYVIGSPYFAPSSRGTNVQWLSFYTPWDISDVTQDGTAIGHEADREFDRNVTRVQIAIPPGGTTEIVAALTGRHDPSGPYHLGVWSQTTVNPDQLTVDIQLPGTRIASGQPELTADGSHWRADVVLDRNLDMYLNKSADQPNNPG